MFLVLRGGIHWVSRDGLSWSWSSGVEPIRSPVSEPVGSPGADSGWSSGVESTGAPRMDSVWSSWSSWAELIVSPGTDSCGSPWSSWEEPIGSPGRGLWLVLRGGAHWFPGTDSGWASGEEPVGSPGMDSFWSLGADSVKSLGGGLSKVPGVAVLLVLCNLRRDQGGWFKLAQDCNIMIGYYHSTFSRPFHSA